MPFTTLYDGGLSVRIDGRESRSITDGLWWESTNQGDAGAGFTAPVADPFNVRGQHPQLRHGAPVVVEHTYAGLTTRLYTGWIMSDPSRGYAGEIASVDVECAGALEVAKSRGDMGFCYTDADTGAWFAEQAGPALLRLRQQRAHRGHRGRQREGALRPRRHHWLRRLQRRDAPAASRAGAVPSVAGAASPAWPAGT